MRMTRWLLLVALCSLVVAIGSVVGATDAGLRYTQPGGDATPILRLPPVDNAALLAEDSLNQGPGVAPRFALPLPVKIAPETHGIWRADPAGRHVWELRVQSPGATSLNLGFTAYFMPEGGELLIFDSQRPTRHIRPFTAADNAAHGQLWTPILETDDVTLRVTLPARARSQLRLNLTAVNHGYRTFDDIILSGSCNVDVVCSEGDDWRSEIRSVAVIGLSGSTFCTGFLVNNTANDLTPYFMTANHCGVNGSNAASLVVYWNYENSWCRPVGSPVNGEPGDGTLDQFQTGSFFRASYSSSDFTLVELDEAPAESFNVHWAGWDATPADATSATAIHHPNTDEKRISFEDEPTTTTSYLGTSSPGDGTHIRVQDWDLGTTEPGSSGSPLFNQDHRIVGQLHGGYAACGNNLADWYGRLSVSWTGGGSNATRLSNWLDPLNLGVLVWDGRDQTPDFNLAVTPTMQDICVGAPTAEYTVSVGSQSGFNDPVTLSASASGSFSPNPVTPPGDSLFTLNTGGYAPGSYSIDITGSSTTGDQSIGVMLDVFAGNPSSLTLLSPADGALDVSVSPTFSWSATDASSYDLTVFDGGTPVLEAVGLTTTSHTFATALEPSHVYTWRVRAHNACGFVDSVAFTFTTRAVPPLLLVDDDDNDPDVRSFYTTLLDALDLDYDIWDTINSDNEPDAGLLSAYQGVIWFTGDEFGGAAGPGAAGETALSDWLSNNPGCFIISSQDYYWDRGLTSFMTTYLGVVSAVSDISQTQVTGQVGPFKDQTYTLSYPFTNYSDRLNAAPGAKVVFIGNQGNAAVAKAGGDLTMYLGFPIEAMSQADAQFVIGAVLSKCLPGANYDPAGLLR